MLDYTLTEEQEMIRDLARSFAKKEILPAAELYDRNDEYPLAHHQKGPQARAD